MKRLNAATAVLAGLCLSVCAIGPAWSQAKPPEAHGPSFRLFGPAVGNRVASVAGVPGDLNTWYFGAASGGIWKSVDGGNRWDPIFDKQPVAAIGALAVAPTDPNIVWAGTGEAWAIRDADVGGDGVYKSTDAGKTWTHMGLDGAGRIGRVIIDPKDPNVVYVCATGRMTAPQEDRGVFKTTDGGKTWTRSLFVDANTGCSGLSMDAHDNKTLFAGTWQVEMHVWGMFSGGPGSGVFVSHDAGATWTRLDKGLPKSPVGKIDVAVAPSDSKRVYALIQTDSQGAMWRSDDGGETWKVVSWDRTLIGRAGYYIRLAVSPTDPNKVFVASSSFHLSTDGGATFPAQRGWGGDNHDIWIDPKNADRFAITFDGGAIITQSGGKGFHDITLPIGQMYHTAVDDQVPYWVYGNMQDDGTMRGPSVPRPGGFGPNNDGWDYHMGGCESGFTLPDVTNPDIVWATCYGDEVTRWNAKTRQARSISPYKHTLDSAPDQVKYRCHWTPPLAIDPFDHKTVYYGCQVVFKTTDEGQSWSVISPDLSTKDPAHIKPSGGLIGDNLGQFYGEVVFAIAPSTVKRGLIWAGTNDGKVWYTSDAGRSWNDVTANIAGMPKGGVVAKIEPSPFDAATAYIAVDAHLSDDRAPYIFKTADSGKTWTRLSDGLPKGELGYIRTVTEDPNQRGLLFAGSGQALYYSLDDGRNWSQFKDEGLPPAPVTWTVVQKRFHDLVVSTWGRGIYILDDITPLEQMAAAANTGDVRLFKPRQTYRLDNDRGAIVDFWLKAAPKKDVTIQIVDAKGTVVRTMYKPAKAGLNRVIWDLAWDDLHTIRLQTVPSEDPHIWEAARFKGKKMRPITHWGMSGHQSGPEASPGKYEVRLTVDGVTQSAPLEVLIDPNAVTTVADMKATEKLQLRIAGDVAHIGDRVSLIEQMRKQIEDQKAKLAGKDPETAAALDAMDAKMQAVEYGYFSKVLAASDDKFFVTAYKSYYDLLWLNAEVGGGAGDVPGGGDHKPTDTAISLLAGYENDMHVADGPYDQLMASDVPGFNQMLASKGLAALDLKLAPAPEGWDRPGAGGEEDDAVGGTDD
jgi:photosystem II stability/assembly factor-like uncharacterized protein